MRLIARLIVDFGAQVSHGVLCGGVVMGCCDIRPGFAYIHAGCAILLSLLEFHTSPCIPLYELVPVSKQLGRSPKH